MPEMSAKLAGSTNFSMKHQSEAKASDGIVLKSDYNNDNKVSLRDVLKLAQTSAGAVADEEEYIAAGKTVCVYTTRALITADTGDKEDDLRLSVKISEAVASMSNPWL